MSFLELHHGDGKIDTRELSRTQPLTIGRQPFNDICVQDDGVGAMHCRVLWSKDTFEVTAATSGGVEVNGTSVAHARLLNGDVIRVGSLDLVYLDGAIGQTKGPDDSDFRLRDDLFQEVPRGNPRDASKPPRPEKEEPRETAPPAPRSDRPRPPAPAANPPGDLSVFDGKVYTESQAEIAIQAGELEESFSNEKLKAIPGRPATSRTDARKQSPRGSKAMTLSARPGEQDIFRSPLVLGLGLGGLVLVLVTGIFWFLIGREQSSRLYDRAVAELNEGQYTQSIASFEKFLELYAGHSLHRQAERGLGKARIQKEISGATPAWKRGLEQLHELITRHRNEPDFAELHPVLLRYAEEISLGAARSAESARDPDLLIVSEDAQVVLERFSDQSAPPTATIGRIKEARVAAVIAISKQKVFDDGMTAVDAALAARQPMVALSEREKLVRAFEGFASHKRVKEALQKALDLERSVIVIDDHERAAETTDATAPDVPPALPLFHTRTRTDESSQGRIAFVLAKDCLYGVDTITGELVWRRVIGFDSPFFPLTVSGSQPGLLVYDAYQQSLLCCQPVTGKLIWRQKVDARPRSAPLVLEGQIYLPTDDHSLCRIDLETGRLTERATFSQNVHGPPTLSEDGNHLLIPGEMSMIYALSMRPLAPAATTFTDHAAGSIAAPPIALGKLLLLCENDRADSSRLRLWDATNPKAPLVELTANPIRVRGQVREAPILRGNQLVVPSSGEQLAAFSVNDDVGREGLSPVAQYRIREDEDIEKRRATDEGDKDNPEPVARPVAATARVPLYVVLGADRQFWAASSAFRRFEIGPDAIHMDSNALALGIATQNLQLIGDQFFVGRKATFHDAVIFSAVDRDRMVSPWRTVLGTRLLELVPGRAGGAVGLSEAGHVILAGPDRLRTGGIDLKGAVELDLPNHVQQPLITSTLHDGRIFMVAVGDVTQLWIISTGGQIDLNSKLAKKELVQSGAVLVDDGLIVPLPGRLKLVPVAGGRKAVQDWLAPAGEKPAPAWKHLLRLDSDEILAFNADGLLMRIQVRIGDVPHLAEAAKIQLDQPVDIAPIVRGDSLVLAEAAGTIKHLNCRTFDLEGSRKFPSPVRGLWLAGSSWLVWSGDGKLNCISEGRDLPIRWSLDLKGLEPAGPPLEDGQKLWIACRDGSVISVDSGNGTDTGRLRVPQALTMGLKKFDDAVFAVACDGALYRLELSNAK